MSKNIYGSYGGTPKTNTGGLNIRADTLDMVNTVNEISTDGTMGGNSDIAIPTEKATKTYTDATVSGADEWIRTGTLITPKTTGDTLGIDTIQSEDGVSDISVTNTTDFSVSIKTDTIDESTATSGVTIDSTLIKDGGIEIDRINADTLGLNIKGDSNGDSTMGLYKDNTTDKCQLMFLDNLTQKYRFELGTSNEFLLYNQNQSDEVMSCVDTDKYVSFKTGIKTDLIDEYTSTNGVTIDSVLLKDGYGTFANTGAGSSLLLQGNGSTGKCVVSMDKDQTAVESIIDFSDQTVSKFIIGLKDDNDYHIYNSNTSKDSILVATSDDTVSLVGVMKVDTINEYTSDTGVTIDSVLIKDGDVTISSNLQSLINKTFSNAGVVSGGVVTDGGSGTVDISECVCYLRTTNSDTGELLRFTIAASSGVALTDNSENYVYVDYNAGTPQFAVTTTGSTVRDNENTLFELAEVYRSGTTLTITTHAQISSNTSKRLQRFLYQKFLHTRTSGLVLGETGTRNITVTAGKVWIKLNEISVSAIDTSAADDFSQYYYNGAAWVEVASATQWDNTQYNNTASGLVTMTNNRFSFQEFFILGNGNLVSVYADDEYVALARAENASVITTLPDIISEHSTYIGRVVFQKSDATAQSILNPFDTTLNFSAVTDHGNLTGLTDDDHTQYSLLTGRNGDSLAIDDITEFNTDHGVEIDGVLLKDGTIQVNPSSTDTGVTILGDSNGDALLKIDRDTASDNAYLRFNTATANKWYFGMNGTVNLKLYSETLTSNIFEIDESNGDFILDNVFKVDTIEERNGGSGITFSHKILVDTIDEKTASTGVTIDGLLLKDQVISAANVTLKTTGGSGHIYMKDGSDAIVFDYDDSADTFTFNDSLTVSVGNKIITNEIDNYNAVAGIDIEGTKFLSNNVDCQGTLKTDDILEHTTDHGVEIESVLIKDGELSGIGTLTIGGSNTEQLKIDPRADGLCRMRMTRTASSDSSIIRIFTDTTENWQIGMQASVTNWGIYNNGQTENAFVVNYADSTLTAGPTYSNTVSASPRDLEIDSSGNIGYVSSILASKMNISEVLDNDINFIYNVPVKRFQYRQTDDEGKYTSNPVNEIQYGMIAEELINVDSGRFVFYSNEVTHTQECIDEAKIDDTKSCPLSKEQCTCSCSHESKLKGISYKKFIPILIKTIQVLKADITILQNKVYDLENP